MNTNTLSKNHDLAILLLRIAVGVVFIFAGWGKLNGIEGIQQYFGSLGIPLAGIVAWLVALIEFIGGIMVLVGFKARIPNILLAVIMFCAFFLTKLSDFSITAANVRVDIIMFLVTVSLAIMGSGSLSVDAKMGRRE